MISIHALREEGDVASAAVQGENQNFYPRPPRGGRQDSGTSGSKKIKFLSTPSARRATWLDKMGIKIQQFLSTPSARRATLNASRRLTL